MPRIISEENLATCCGNIAGLDSGLALVLDKYGIPPLWSRKPGFSSLIHIILEQQVSLASAKAAYDKCEDLVGEITPESILSLSDEQMKSVYFSRQKMGYARGLARAIRDGSLDLATLEFFPDQIVSENLTKIKGIGRWTSDIYLLMCLNRPDVMPKGDLALYAAWQDLNSLPDRPDADEFEDISLKWKPLRSVAARILWHFYLCRKSA